MDRHNSSVLCLILLILTVIIISAAQEMMELKEHIDGLEQYNQQLRTEKDELETKVWNLKGLMGSPNH